MKKALGITRTGYAAIGAFGVAAVLVSIGLSLMGWATVACGIYLTYRAMVDLSEA
jgi:hypothetical protein